MTPAVMVSSEIVGTWACAANTAQVTDPSLDECLVQGLSHAPLVGIVKSEHRRRIGFPALSSSNLLTRRPSLS